MSKRQELDRIIVGNQIAIMRALARMAGPAYMRELDARVLDIKDWWRVSYGEEVGFSAGFGDRPPDDQSK